MRATDEKPGSRSRTRYRRWLVAPLGLAGAAALAGAAWAGSGLPDVAALKTGAPDRTAYMALAPDQGEAGAAARIGAVPLDGFSPLLVCAVVKAEDRRFFRHAGIDWPQVRRAVVRSLTGHPMGGSTITQQAARNLYLGPDRSFARKLREAAIAREMEARLGKRRILELYLNSVEWGDGIWGGAAAARHHLADDPRQVDAFGAALLASLLPAPRAPLTGANRRRAERVQRRVLNQLLDAEVITRAEWVDAQVRTDTLHARLRRGMTLHDALAGARARRAPGVPGRTVASAIAGECGLARELGER